MKILILGGYGAFGGRLAQLLKDDPGLTLMLAGRDGAKARAFCTRLGGAALVEPVTLDRADVAAALIRLEPHLVVDASGPFQAYGTDPYLVPKAAIAARVPYLDLADGADFVEGIGALDAEAKRAGVFVLAGVSSFPVLTHAVLTEMRKRMRVARVTGGIAPSPYAGVGMNVLRAVLGYAGAPVRLWRDGKPATGVGLGDSLVATVAVPGHLPLRPLRFSLVDVPDLRLLPPAHGLQGLWMGAAPQPRFLHRLLILLARARSRLHLPSLAPLAPLAHWVLNLHPMGEHRGGMFLAAEGERDGQPASLSWQLLAEGDDGPLIPSMAVALLVGKMRAGQPPAAGARPGIGALTLDDYAAAFRGRSIVTGWRDGPEAEAYPRVLGPAFQKLPPMLQRLHRPGARSVWRGRADVQRGRGPIAALVAALFGFPRDGADQPVEVTFATSPEGRETWARRFGQSLMQSTQEAGTGRDEFLIVERFGPFRFGLGVVWDKARLFIIPRSWSLGPLPLPRWLMPYGPAWEEEEGGRFRFHVEIILPLVGPVVRYDGWLEPVAT